MDDIKKGGGVGFLPKNKKAQEMSTNTIILIILGLIVLVILILGFTMGWDKFVPFLSTNNVDNIKTACALACSTDNTYDFCTTPREVKDGVNDKFPTTCGVLSDPKGMYKDRNYGIAECPSIECAKPAA
jgi:hypothetical protein